MNRRQMTFFKIVLGFMVFVMGIGYPLMLLNGLPGFSELFAGSSTDTVQQQIKDSRADLHKYPYDIKHPDKYKKNLSKRVSALTALGNAYVSKAAPDAETGEAPSDADKNLGLAIEAFKEWYTLKPKSEDALKALAETYDRKSTFDLSKPLWQKLAAKNPTEEVFYYRLGYAAQNAKDNLTAAQAYKTYLKIAPDGANADTVTEALKQLKDPNGGGVVSNFG